MSFQYLKRVKETIKIIIIHCPFYHVPERFLERIVFKHLFNYLCENVCEIQTGFQPGNSTAYPGELSLS